MNNLEEKIFEIKVGEENLKVKINNLVEQANGSAWVEYGQTEVLATATMSEKEKEGIDFFPLTVDYEEKFYAAGKILGSRYMRREGRPNEREILRTRIIDRTIRPLFPEDMRRETQVIAACLSWDGKNNPDILAGIASSIALAISDIPWDGPISLVRVGKINDKFIINPTYEEQKKSKMDLVLGAVKEKGETLINMIDAGAKEVTNDDVIRAVKFAKPFLEEIIDFEEKIVEEIGQPKAKVKRIDPSENFKEEIENTLKSKLEKLIFQKPSRENKKAVEDLKNNFLDSIAQKYPDEPDKINQALFTIEELIRNIVHDKIIASDTNRPDGRKLDQLRDISCAIDILPRVHGSGLFIRGKTKSLSVLTLGSPEDEKTLEGIEEEDKKRFMHQYNFPPYCSGETKPLRSPNRREIGHGMLAEKALRPVIPDFDLFPYTIRIVTEILSSNGSTSQSSICSSSLALMDAGVPIKEPVAGISIGLIKNQKGNDYKLLTDIQGVEDHYGDMDFKVAGTRKGITAIQLDVKIKGLNEEIIEKTLARAKKARLEILDKMKKIIDRPKPHLSPFAPKIKEIKIDPKKIGEVIGPKGKIINGIIEKYGVDIDIEPTGQVFVSSENRESVEKALEWIKNITKEVKVGETFQGKIKKIMNFGVFVEILPGQDGLLHISRFPRGIIPRSLKNGDIIPVKVISIDQEGKVGLALNK